ncbi:DUF106 domain-containing protein [Candidatus Woesearchaeota archaeon]|nr:DUF106 domain-containing protein [Candidatus Woesearchaeota archaeon]
MALLGFMDILLSFTPAVAIIIISLAVSVITTLVYKYTTNQKQLKEMKEEMARLQAEIRTTKEPGRAAQLQKEMMGKSMKQLNSSTKSMLITLVPLFLIFGWMGSHLAYQPVMLGEEFTTTVHFAKSAAQNASALALGNVTLSASEGLEILSSPAQEAKGAAVSWRLKGDKEGAYRLTYSLGDEMYSLNVLLTNEFRYENPVLAKSKGIKKASVIDRITVDLKPLRPFGNFSLLGWEPGWLATYIIFSLAASMLARKLLKVY